MTPPPNLPPTRSSLAAWLVFAAVIVALAVVGMLLPGDPALGSTPRTAVASAFGPGLYGNRMACGGVLHPSTLGVASKTRRCGSSLTISYRGRKVRVRVVDRGPYVHGRDLDLTAATARRLCSCSPRAWGVRRVQVTS